MKFFEYSLPKTLFRRSAAEFRYHFLFGRFHGVIFAWAHTNLMFISLGENIFQCMVFF